MMTAMARLPCKQTSQSSQQQQQQPRYASTVSGSPNFVQSRGYWEMQQPIVHPAAPAYVRNHHRHHADHVGEFYGKRKSAVELLQESKAFYVKSETVLDRKQELKNSGHLQVSQVTAPGAPPRLLRKCASSGPIIVSQSQQQQQQQQPPPPCCWATCHEADRPLPPKSPRLVPVPQRRSVSGPPANGAEQLQVKLRRLLNTDSNENVFFPEAVGLPAPAEYASPPPTSQQQQQQQQQQQVNGGHAQSQQSRDDKFRYSPGGSLSPGCRDDERTWATSVGVESRSKFGRSNSHSHGGRAGRPGSGRSSGHSAGTIDRGERGGGGGGVSVGVGVGGGAGSASSAIDAIGSVVCHKSLPDLHTSTRRRASLSPRASTKSSSRKLQSGVILTSRGEATGCPDCETGSDYSDRSFNRDSVCYRSSRHIRRSMGSGGGDASSVLSSGGRTQKSSGSSKISHGATARDSGGSSGHCTHRSEPPPRIQDCWSHVRRDSGASTQHSTERDRSRKNGSYNNGTPPAIVRHYSPDTDSSNSQTDYSPTCNSRFSDGWKEGRGRPILRSKSDISDRYWRHESGGVTSRGPKLPARPPRSVTQLESFFDRLGLDPDDYQHIADPSSKSSSPVFFDSVSSVDSALGLYSSWAANNSGVAAQSQVGQWTNNCSTGMGNNNEDCLVGGQRAGDPPSIVERNARIIKWLCQCRKVQFGYS